MVKHVKFHLNRFLRRVRIHGGEFDTSARAMYRVSEKGSLISYEKAFSTRADLRIVRRSTIERKQMSTKTTIKRLALVTVAALGLGVLSVAPSSAVPQLDTLSLSSATASTTVGTAVTTKATVAFLQETSSDSMTLTLSYEAAPAGIAIGEVSFSDTSAVTTDLGTPTVDTSTARTAKISAVTAASLNKTLTISLNPSKAGTYVIRVTPTITGSTTAPASTFKTWTVTVAAKTIGWDSEFVTTDTSTANVTADVAVSTTSGAKLTSVGRVRVAHGYGTVSGTDTVTVAAEALAVVVSTDKGLVSKTNDLTAAAKSVTTAAGTAGTNDYWIFTNGDVGKATITITVGARTAATKNVTFVGPATALVATQSAGLASFTGIGAGVTTTHTITATDAAAGAATLPTGLTVASSDTSVATVVISGNNSVVVTGVKAGTSVITVTDPATTAAATAAKYTVTVKALRPTAAPTITFDKAAYNVGEVITMTVNADMADSATASALFTTALVTSAGVTAVAGTTALSTSSAAHAIVGGVATYKFYAPAVSGSFTVTGKTGATVDITTAVDVSKTVDIVNPGVDAATAAAELAEAAAQDATDAALDATEAATLAGALAQEAVDAVADLSTQVATLIAALKKQITTLTNLVIKIQKKVRA
jgi:trimeric autotransporter adhesin